VRSGRIHPKQSGWQGAPCLPTLGKWSWILNKKPLRPLLAAGGIKHCPRTSPACASVTTCAEDLFPEPEFNRGMVPILFHSSPVFPHTVSRLELPHYKDRMMYNAVVAGHRYFVIMWNGVQDPARDQGKLANEAEVLGCLVTPLNMAGSRMAGADEGPGEALVCGPTSHL